MNKFTGKVVSLKNKDTAIVAVPYMYKHPLYKKSLRRTRRFAAHVEGLQLHEGDAVVIGEVRKVSKTKFFRVLSGGGK